MPEMDKPNLNDLGATPRLYPLLPVPECEEHVSRRCQRLVEVCRLGSLMIALTPALAPTLTERGYPLGR